MPSNPVVLGVTSLGAWPETKTLADVMASLGNNTGNLLFAEALASVLKGAVRQPYYVSAQELAGSECIVIAAANWLNSFEDYGWLADKLGHTQCPVFLVGIGAQASASEEHPSIAPGTRRLLEIVRERSNSIAARGEFSCEVLRKAGFKDVVATGCPSLLLTGPRGPRFSALGDASRPVIHATRHAFGIADAFQSFLYRQAFACRFDLLLQSELADMYFALGRTNNAEILARAEQAVTNAYGTADLPAIASYLRSHGRVYINLDDWLSYMRTRTFCVGTRIHGTIASILAGTQATLVAHDSRTVEMAKAMHIPYVLPDTVSRDDRLRVKDLLLNEDCTDLISYYPTYRQRYLDYFASNGLSVADSFT